MKYNKKSENGSMVEMGLVIVGIVVSLILIIMALTGNTEENNTSGSTASSSAYESAASTAVKDDVKKETSNSASSTTTSSASNIKEEITKAVATYLTEYNSEIKSKGTYKNAGAYIIAMAKQGKNISEESKKIITVEEEDGIIEIYSDANKTKLEYEVWVEDDGTLSWE